MDDKELTSLLLALQNTTPLNRVNLAEARVIFEKLPDLGYTIAKTVEPVKV